MPSLMKSIDKIAREKKRDVLFILFHPDVFPGYDYDSWTARNELIEWFKQNDITAFPCGKFASEYCMESYRGQLYIDVPFKEGNPDYEKVREHLEFPDGTFRIPGAWFCYHTLEDCMRNKHHDEPGFWENWADNF